MYCFHHLFYTVFLYIKGSVLIEIILYNKVFPICNACLFSFLKVCSFLHLVSPIYISFYIKSFQFHVLGITIFSQVIIPFSRTFFDACIKQLVCSLAILRKFILYLPPFVPKMYSQYSKH